MNGHHIRLNTSSKPEKSKSIYYMNGHNTRLHTSPKHKKTKSICYEQSPHQSEDSI